MTDPYCISVTSSWTDASYQASQIKNAKLSACRESRKSGKCIVTDERSGTVLAVYVAGKKQ